MTKDTKDTLYGISLLVGVILLALANVGGIGYGLYLWVVVDTTFKIALWKAFLLWISFLTSGSVFLLVGLNRAKGSK